MEVAGEIPAADVSGEVAVEMLPEDIGDSDIFACSSNEECETAFPNPGPCLLAMCDTIAGTCIVGQAKDGEECEDLDLCTEGTVCLDGECGGGDAVVCDDENECTDDDCSPEFGCVFEANILLCDDGNKCTNGDACADGNCGGAAIVCDDDNPCTADSCDENEGCIYEPLEGIIPCDDGDLCTDEDVCDDGDCHGVAIACDDENECTADTCEPESGCVYTPAEGEPCEDNNPCTVDDLCVGEACQSGENVCQCEEDDHCKQFEDGDVCNGTLICVDAECVLAPDSVIECDTSGDTQCTFTVCNPISGACAAISAGYGTPCDDENACTIGETCMQGLCIGGILASCDDDNPCTDDLCEPGSGCVYEAVLDQACDDGDWCTDADYCLDGVCLGGPNSCTCDTDENCLDYDDGNACNGTLSCQEGVCVTPPGSIVECSEPSGPCSQIFCNPYTGICEEDDLPDGLPCDDEDACTMDDICVGGVCVGGEIPCDDEDPCTVDLCHPDLGCAHEPIDEVPCDDLNPCTTNDICQDGVCAGEQDPSLCGECEDDSDCLPMLPPDWDFCNGALKCVDQLCVADPDSIVTCDTSQNSECVLNLCNPETVACELTTLPDGTLCDDGLLCTKNDICTGGECAGVLLGCDDGNSCTDDVCLEDEGGCVFYTNTLPCDDGSACTAGDHCAEGACAGVLVNCDDGNGCTDDLCDADTGCLFEPGSGACDDGDMCTDGDSCIEGECMGEPVSCNDDNLCTDDVCDPDEGCFNYFNDEPCEDGDPCTLADHCAGGECTSGDPPDCDDGNGCSTDYCAEGDCLHKPLTGDLCDDGDVCTDGDQCKDGQCGGAPISCDDQNECTDDACDPEWGCYHTYNSVSCEDGDACTDGDSCVQGQCLGGPAVVCEDGNVCTEDSCESPNGCVFLPVDGGECTDDDVCTGGDTCSGGACVGAMVKLCLDNNPCTLDSCDPVTGCQHQPVSGEECDDGSLCTDMDSCDDGVCTGVPVDCSDDNPCTEDQCDPLQGCFHPPVPDDADIVCDDQDPCSAPDLCVSGQCQGEPVVCDDGNVCTDDWCDQSSGDCMTSPNDEVCDDQNPCTLGDGCAGSVCVGGAWKLCDDSNPCTDDECVPQQGGCVSTPNDECQCQSNADCDDDDNMCNGTPICVDFVCVVDPDQQIVCDGSEDTDCLKSTCNPDTGACEPTAVPDDSPCDDSSMCTTNDRCGQGICVGDQVDCDDGNHCTTDSCLAATGCKHTNNAKPCDDADACTVDDKCGGGVCVGDPFNCDDTNPCTNDVCVAAADGPQCFYQFNSDPCEDGSVCTEQDTCSGGDCIGLEVTCNDGNHCTTDSCDAAQGCIFDPNTLPCDDDDPCTVSDVCADSACAGVPKNCVDNNVCTDDYCEADSGDCAHDFNTVSCNDGNICTEDDQCQQGVCTGADIVCDDGNQCTSDLCEPDSGCVYPPVGGGVICDDGDVCTEGDHCLEGECGGAPVPGCCNEDVECDDAYGCTVDSCVNHACDSSLMDCSDDNECTADYCDAGECFHSSLGEVQVVYFEDFDAGNAPGWDFVVNEGGVAETYWSVDDYRSHSPEHSLYAGNPETHSYDNGIGNATAISPPVALPEGAEAGVGFRRRMIRAADEWADCNYDYLEVGVEVVGGEVVQLVTRVCENTDDFVVSKWDISDYAGQTVRIHVSFRTGDAQFNGGEGAYVDDFTITAGPAPGCCSYDGDCDDDNLCSLDSCDEFTCGFTAEEGSYFAEDFDDGEIATNPSWNPETWHLSTNNLKLNWQVDDERSTNTPFSLYCGDVEHHDYDNGMGEASARTPRVDLPSGTSPKLRFELWSEVAQQGCNNDVFTVVAYSAIWNGLSKVMYTRCNDTEGFQSVEVDLSEWAGQQIYLQFVFDVSPDKNGAEGIYVDDIRVEETGQEPSCCHNNGECDDDDKCTADICEGMEGGGICFNNQVVSYDEDFDDGNADGWLTTSNNMFVSWTVDDHRNKSAPNSLYCGNTVNHTYLGYGAGTVTALTPFVTLDGGNGLSPYAAYDRYTSIYKAENHCLTVSVQTQFPYSSKTLETVCGTSLQNNFGWTAKSYDLSEFNGLSVRLSFVFTFYATWGNDQTSEGVYIDDVEIKYDGCD